MVWIPIIFAILFIALILFFYLQKRRQKLRTIKDQEQITKEEGNKSAMKEPFLADV